MHFKKLSRGGRRRPKKVSNKKGGAHSLSKVAREMSKLPRPSRWVQEEKDKYLEPLNRGGRMHLRYGSRARHGAGLGELFKGFGNLLTSPFRLIKGLVTGFPKEPPQPTGYEQQR